MSRLLSALVAVSVAAAACGPGRRGPAPRTASSTASTSTAAPQQGMSNGSAYTVTVDTAVGATPDGVGHWHTQTGQLADGDPAVIAAFNTASNASAAGMLDQTRRDASVTGLAWNFETTPTVMFRPIAVSELLVGVYYAARAAHPVDYVSTIVIDSRDARPITLTTLFGNESRGLQRLSEQTKLIFPTVYGHGPMLDEPGNQPLEQNFANWIPTAAGMEIHFADDQFGHGLPVITVPWTALADVLAPEMAALRS